MKNSLMKKEIFPTNTYFQELLSLMIIFTSYLNDNLQHYLLLLLFLNS